MTIPAASYTDPDQWRAEIDVIFKRVPLMLALSCEMPKSGDYKAMEAVSLPIQIARGKTGTARAYLNVCAHRWSPVAAEVMAIAHALRAPFMAGRMGPTVN